ncbi:hypothetical protein BJ322DRAFT_998545, partial [Thelephora terrestris]
EPITPARDPASIDRRGLVGVGELATPRWTRAPRVDDDEDQTDFTLNDHDGDYEQEDPDSPWTIEARDGETESIDVSDVPQPPRSVRIHPSMADESGGEEILYPRQSSQSEQRPLQHIPAHELDQAPLSDPPGNTSRIGPSQPLSKDRKHRGLGVGPPPGQKTKDRRRDQNLTPSKESIGVKSDKHSRNSSIGSSPSHDHSRRVHTTDFSHLPPSPSTSSIHHLLKGTGNIMHSPSNVAQSLLRGTQEGWSGMDDEATIDALRKLDGLSSKSAHASSRVSAGGASRANSLSRPGTPAKPTTSQWEGVDGKRTSRRISTRIESGSEGKRDSGSSGRNRTGEHPTEGVELHSVATTSDDANGPIPSDRVVRKTSARLSYNTKRASTSSANHTSPTTSSRDSASLSASTSVTSVSTTSGRYPGVKPKRNSTDVHSAGESASDKERAGSGQESALEQNVPPVPPLPKGLSTYRSPPPSSSTAIFPQYNQLEHHESVVEDEDADRTFSADIPPTRTPSKSTHYLNGQDPPTGGYLMPGSAPAIMKTPSKKWSFTNAFKLAASPTSTAHKDKHSGSPFSATTAQIRKSLSKDRSLVNASSETWSAGQPDAMTSATSLTSLSSVGHPANTNVISSHVVEDRTSESDHPNRMEYSTGSNTNTTLPPPAPLSPTSSVHQGSASSKRLTPSSIPFFRRSSSQSIHFPSSAIPNSTSPTTSSASYSGTRAARPKSGSSPSTELPSTSSLSTPSTNRKSSMLSLGIPSLLKGSSSRKSLHGGDKSDTGRDSDRDASRSKQKEKDKIERSKLKKEDKERSESRISVLMGRKRGKTLSSTDPKKAKPVSLPPMQVAAIPPSTANRVAGLKSSSNSTLPSTSSTPRSSITSRATSHTASSMQKQSDTSLRRHQLPTIAGSPSVGTVGHTSSKEGPPLSSNNTSSALSKETPTKIPRIASRSSTVTSPTLKSRRTSAHVSETTPSSESPTASHEFFNEFGILETPPTSTKLPPSRHSVRASPSTTGSVSRVPRQSTTSSSSNLVASVTRKANRESLSFAGLRKASTSSVTSFNVPAETSTSHHRFSALSPSKGLKLLSPKVSLSAARIPSSSASHSHRYTVTSPSSSQQSLLTPSSSPNTVVDEDEVVGDEEMLQYIKRQQAKRLAHGATQEELDELLRFPEPLPPVPPLLPAAVLKSTQAQYLSPYERKEILDYQAVYFIGARSEKKQATPENATNNHGYDDERGDYQVVTHDHLAFRYEVTDTLGKGSFGQVLSCRDHCTGQSVAVKIIRNKKRFHHQALVEIKILDNLRKWDPDDKHNVIKMTEHFYFRGHLCIAMELLSINLYELIKANGFVGFTSSLIRRFTSQMLMSLSLMRHHRIVHCDLKPENVLLKHPAKSAIKVIDFGSSCLEHEKMYTYIQSRFYRSPEVILGMSYHMAIDMWSLGCIMAELYTGFPIFPGENEQEQLSCIMEILGVPEKEFINRSSRKRLFFDSTGAPRPVVNSKGRRRRPGTKSLAQVLRTDDHLFVDFIAKCLVWDPERRMKPQAALRHDFITSGRRHRITSPSPSVSKPLTLPLSSKQKGGETPKKSQISAPTPLTARSSRTTLPTTPSTLSSLTLNTSRSHRTSQQQPYSGYYSARTINSLTVRRVCYITVSKTHPVAEYCQDHLILSITLTIDPSLFTCTLESP